MTNGRYSVIHPAGGYLRLDPDGTAVIYDQCESQKTQSQYYVMRHFDNVIAETINKQGAHYIITNFGENRVDHLCNTETESETRASSLKSECSQQSSEDNSCIGNGHKQKTEEKCKPQSIIKLL